MRINLLLRLVVGGALAASPGLASTIQATFTGVNGANAFGVYIGEYYGQLASQNVSLFCDDFVNDVNFGQTWQANLSRITPGSDLSQTRYGGESNALTKYQEIGWLDTQFAQQSTSQWADIHATIWQIFNPQQAPTPTSNYWLQQAQLNYMTLNYDNFRVITNEGPVLRTGQVQEFLTVLAPNSSLAAVGAPEPSPAILIGSGLLLAGFATKVLHRRRILKT